MYDVDVNDGSWREVRSGTNDFWCHRPIARGFHAFCVHESNVPRSKALYRLLAQGMPFEEAWNEVDKGFRAGTIPLPAHGALNFWVSGPDKEHTNLLTIISMPFATADSIDQLQTEEGGDGKAWLMGAGSPGAHIMIGSPPYGP